MRSQDHQPQLLNNLNTLNLALLRLHPSISGISVMNMETKGANLPMLDFVIGADATVLYNGLKRVDLIRILKPALAARVNVHPIAFVYETHGDKHFPGGPEGTKFTAVAATVNRELEVRMMAHIGSIRRDANGTTKNYFLQSRPNQYTANTDFVIQVTYTAAPEHISYHGYPDDEVVRYGLLRSLNGLTVPP